METVKSLAPRAVSRGNQSVRSRDSDYTALDLPSRGRGRDVAGPTHGLGRRPNDRGSTAGVTLWWIAPDLLFEIHYL